MATREERSFTLTKLDGDSNWLTWKWQMKLHLTDKDLFGVVDGTETLDEGASEKKKLEHQKKKSKAMSAIGLSVGSKVALIIRGLEDPQVAWKKLEGHFELNTAMTRLYQRQKYYSIRMAEGSSAEKHLEEMMGLAERLQSMGAELSQEEQVSAILASLPRSYKSLVQLWASRVKELTVERLYSIIMDDQTRESGQSQSVAEEDQARSSGSSTSEAAV